MFLALLTWLATAAEPVPVERYSHALHLVNKLYLYPDRLDERLLQGPSCVHLSGHGAKRT